MRNILIYLGFIIIMFSCSSGTSKGEAKVPTSDDLMVSFVIEKGKGFECYDGTQSEMTLCSITEFNYFDSISNYRYQELMKIIDSRLADYSDPSDLREYDATKSHLMAIKESQVAWGELVQKNKKIIELTSGGSMFDMLVNRQLTEDTKNRILFLEKLIELKSN
jgi:uncharacterized protein YecT (DUF1311 family)